MDLKLAGKRALITGGGRGIGLTVARALLQEGAHVAIASLTEATIKSAAKTLTAETGGTVHGFTVDTRADDSVNRLVADAAKSLGGIDILINGAARPGGAPGGGTGLTNTTSEYAMEELNTKVIGYLRVARACAPHMIAGGWGRIINISGLAARKTGSLTGSIRNAAVQALTKGLADELSPKGINVTTVHPGATRTERTAEFIKKRAQADGVSEAEAEKRMYSAQSLIGRIVEAEEVADVIVFLASPRSVSITGDVIATGGGAAGAIYY
jgi:NAD(P)-dependent dehydrogenase (short-subunit alcohol dehydrogenase family)